jgi:hypothetical protein
VTSPTSGIFNSAGGAYSSTLGFVKEISEGIEAYLHEPSPIYMSSESSTRQGSHQALRKKSILTGVTLL